MVPAILAAIGIIAGGKGVIDTVQGMSKMSEASGAKKDAEIRHKNNINKFQMQNQATCTLMDEIGKRELTILKSFEEFSNIIERIQGNKGHLCGMKKQRNMGIWKPSIKLEHVVNSEEDAL